LNSGILECLAVLAAFMAISTGLAAISVPNLQITLCPVGFI